MTFTAEKVVKTTKTFSIEDVKSIVRIDDKKEEIHVKEGFSEMLRKSEEYGEQCGDPFDEEEWAQFPRYELTLKDGTEVIFDVFHDDEPYDEFSSYKFMLK